MLQRFSFTFSYFSSPRWRKRLFLYFLTKEGLRVMLLESSAYSPIRYGSQKYEGL